MSDTPLRHCSDRELLALLLGDDVAHRLADRSLVDLFGLSSYPPSVSEALPDDASTARLAVAKELMCRALAESLRQCDVLDSPDRIRELLRLRYAGMQHELFVVLLLAAHHLKVLDTVEEKIHPRDGGGGEVLLLPVQLAPQALHVAMLFLHVLHCC
jgi:DNA repair protein RadC